MCTGHHQLRDAYVLPLQGDAGGWDRMGAVDELRSALVATTEDIGTIDRFVRNAPSTNATAAVPAIRIPQTTLQAQEMRIDAYMIGPRRDPSSRPRRSQEHELAAAASTQSNEEHSLGVAAKQAADSDEVTTPDDETADQDAPTVSEEEMPAGM